MNFFVSVLKQSNIGFKRKIWHYRPTFVGKFTKLTKKLVCSSSYIAKSKSFVFRILVDKYQLDIFFDAPVVVIRASLCLVLVA